MSGNIHQHTFGGPPCVEDHDDLFSDDRVTSAPVSESGAMARAAALAAGRDDWMDVIEVWWWKGPKT